MSRRLAALLLLLAGCRPTATPPPPPPPAQVTVARPLQRDVTHYHEYTGRIDAVETVEVRARVRGFLQKVHFREGVEVKKGDPLYEIDPREFQAEVDRAKAEIARLDALLKQAGLELERVERLRGTGGVTESELVGRTAARDEARANLDKAKAALDSAQLQIDFTKINAPIDGKISRTLVTEGNLVGAGEMTLLTTIVRMDPVYVYFDVPQRNVLEYDRLVRQQQAATAATATVPVHVGLETEPGQYPHRGVVNFRDNRLDRGTGTMMIRGELPNPQRVLLPGLFANVRVPIGRPQPRLLIPETAIALDQRGRYVLVVNAGDVVEYRPVTVGAAQGDDLTVILTGLKAEDWVVVNGLQRARPQAKVAPQRQELKVGDTARNE